MSIETRICGKRDCDRTASFAYCSQPFCTTYHIAPMAKLAAKPNAASPKQRTRAQRKAARRAPRPAWCGTPGHTYQPTSFSGLSHRLP